MAQLRKSIFNNTVQLNGFSYIHFQLLYKTNNMLFFQMYADALENLVKLTKLENVIYFKLIQNIVAEFSNYDLAKIQAYIINIVSDTNFLNSVKERFIQSQSVLPQLFNEFEYCIYNNEKPSKEIFEKIYKDIVYALAVNYMDFVAEAYLPDYLKSTNAQFYNKYLTQNTFSHVKYYKEKQGSINDDMPDFLRNYSFLANELGDETKYEDIDFLKSTFNNEVDRNIIFNGKFSYPHIEFDVGLNDSDYKEIPIILKWAKLFQSSLEYRHYWMLRFARDLRCYLNYDYNKIRKWLYNDYTNELL
ncbi:hypothetical protein II906_00300 [bacterium]|nr:hypothetical protein [bacterium]